MMEEYQILLVAKCAAVLAGILTFFVFRLVEGSIGAEEKLLGAYHELSGMLKKKKTNGFYQTLNSWLVKKGAPFHYGKWMNPLWLMALTVIFGTVGGGICFPMGIWWGVVGMLIPAVAPSLLLLYLDSRDTEKQLPELKLVYHALEIQIKAGVYVTDALAECYGSVQEPRLKAALLELAGNLVMKADVFESLDQFQSRFDNRYIDSLCITIIQALESGQAVELLQDIGEQIKDMEESVLEKKKAALDRTITFCQLGVLTVVLGLALYVCITYMFQTAVVF